MTATRRLAAILAADVAGYSRLMGADEEGTLERLMALRGELLDPKIAEHHGRIVKTTGDRRAKRWVWATTRSRRRPTSSLISRSSSVAGSIGRRSVRVRTWSAMVRASRGRTCSRRRQCLGGRG
jgi:class 3 adenylate cyclase